MAKAMTKVGSRVIVLLLLAIGGGVLVWKARSVAVRTTKPRAGRLAARSRSR